jgi:hypothetical protein
MPAIRITLAQVGIRKSDTELLGGTITGLYYQIVFLVRADEQGSGKSLKTTLFCHFCRPVQTQTKAVTATVRLVPSHGTEVRHHIVTILY